MPWFTWGAGRQWAGFGAAVPAGVALGGLNLLMARASSDSARAGGRLDGLLDAVRAGVAEELGIRLCLLALCIYLIGRLPRTRLEQVLTYLVMVVPHAALHFVTMPTQLRRRFSIPEAGGADRCSVAGAMNGTTGRALDCAASRSRTGTLREPIRHRVAPRAHPVPGRSASPSRTGTLRVAIGDRRTRDPPPFVSNMVLGLQRFV